MYRLRSVLKEYASFASCKIEVSVKEKDENIVIRWDHVKGDWRTFHEKEFPKEDLDSRILHYRNKVNRLSSGTAYNS